MRRFLRVNDKQLIGSTRLLAVLVDLTGEQHAEKIEQAMQGQQPLRNQPFLSAEDCSFRSNEVTNKQASMDLLDLH